MHNKRIKCDEAKKHDGSWANYKKGKVLELLDLDAEQYENPQVYWMVIEQRLDKMNLTASERKKMREVVLEMMFDC